MLLLTLRGCNGVELVSISFTQSRNGEASRSLERKVYKTNSQEYGCLCCISHQFSMNFSNIDCLSTNPSNRVQTISLTNKKKPFGFAERFFKNILFFIIASMLKKNK